jgi:hypothetical protein
VQLFETGVEPFHANWSDFETLSRTTISDFDEIWHVCAVAMGRI